MKNSILNLGKTLNKKEQQTINGGRLECYYRADGDTYEKCHDFGFKCAETWCQIL